MAYNIIEGRIAAPEKVIIYGPEGIGKSTLAAQFPGALFIDTEGGTKKLNVRRLPAPSSWAMLMDEVAAVHRGEVACGTLVIDTADWAERLCVRAVCDKAKLAGLEDFGYGKGYVYLKEEFGRLLDRLEEVIGAGKNVVVTAHAQLQKFEQPDEMGAYDRWTMKTSKNVAPLLREWCDTLLFCNYKTIVVKEGTGAMAKSKAQGGRRVMYTTHHACWDAKNRDGLPEECPMEYSVLAPYILDAAPRAVTSPPQRRAAPAPPAVMVEDGPPPAPKPAPAPAPAPLLPTPGEDDSKTEGDGIPAALLALMHANHITARQVQQAVAIKGYFPEDMPIRDYPADFVDGCLVAAWPQLLTFINDNCDLPF